MTTHNLLISRLEIQREVLLRLLELNREERACILGHQLDRLEEIISEQATLLKRQAKLSEQIGAAIEQLGAGLQLEGWITLARVAEALTGDQAQPLCDLHRELTALSTQLQRESQVNWHLAQQALQYIDFTLKAIGSLQEGPRTYKRRPQRETSAAVQLLMDHCA
jgi:hypothetical protein